VKVGRKEWVKWARMSCWIRERRKKEKNRSKSKTRKPTIIKLTITTKKTLRNQWGEMNKQTRNKNKQTKFQDQEQ
jgi:hypothetical protein